MTITIKHQFVSLKGDGTDATQVQPSNWNATHSLSMASGQLVGRLTAGVGAFEEIPISAYMAGLLAAADAPTLATLLGLFETGDVKYTFKTTASGGWVLMLGGAGTQVSTIGSAASNAVLRANADTLNLYTVIWNGCDNTAAPIYDSTGAASTRGGSALSDFNANKRLAIPNPVGKALLGAGAAITGMAVLSSLRNLGYSNGEETHLLTTAEMPAHNHPVFLNDPGHFHSISGFPTQVGQGTSGGGLAYSSSTTVNTNSAVTGITVRDTSGGGGTANQTALTGGGGTHNNMQPSIALNCMVKL